MRFITEFSKETLNKIGYYVYLYSDPDTMQPFYVGKGKNNRVFNHLTDTSDSKKVAKIQELNKEGKSPIIEILAHELDEETALKIEAATIDLIGIDNLTNNQRGHRSSTYGRIDVTTLNARYCVEKLAKEDIDDDVILIRINQNYRSDLHPNELYDVTRGIWMINIERAKNIKYAFAVYDGLIIEIYTIACWLPAGTSYSYRIDKVEGKYTKRYEFIGNIAPEEIRNKYINKNVADLFKTGNQNPIMFIEHN
ncbi:MAG: LEM-3-like GIY-YIG domain-containing protein [Aminipila sp.]